MHGDSFALGRLWSSGKLVASRTSPGQRKVGGFPDVSRAAESWWLPGRLRGSGKGWPPGGIGLSGLGQRCGELIANCD